MMDQHNVTTCRNAPTVYCHSDDRTPYRLLDRKPVLLLDVKMASAQSIADVDAALQRKEDEVVKVQQRIDAAEKELEKATSDEDRMQIRRIIEKREDEKNKLRDQQTALQNERMHIRRQRMFLSVFHHWFSIIAHSCCLRGSLLMPLICSDPIDDSRIHPRYGCAFDANLGDYKRIVFFALRSRICSSGCRQCVLRVLLALSDRCLSVWGAMIVDM